MTSREERLRSVDVELSELATDAQIDVFRARTRERVAPDASAGALDELVTSVTELRALLDLPARPDLPASAEAPARPEPKHEKKKGRGRKSSTKNAKAPPASVAPPEAVTEEQTPPPAPPPEPIAQLEVLPEAEDAHAAELEPIAEPAAQLEVIDEPEPGAQLEVVDEPEVEAVAELEVVDEPEAEAVAQLEVVDEAAAAQLEVVDEAEPIDVESTLPQSPEELGVADAQVAASGTYADVESTMAGLGDPLASTGYAIEPSDSVDFESHDEPENELDAFADAMVPSEPPPKSPFRSFAPPSMKPEPARIEASHSREITAAYPAADEVDFDSFMGELGLDAESVGDPAMPTDRQEPDLPHQTNQNRVPASLDSLVSREGPASFESFLETDASEALEDTGPTPATGGPAMLSMEELFDLDGTTDIGDAAKSLENQFIGFAEAPPLEPIPSVSMTDVDLDRELDAIVAAPSVSAPYFVEEELTEVNFEEDEPSSPRPPSPRPPPPPPSVASPFAPTSAEAELTALDGPEPDTQTAPDVASPSLAPDGGTPSKPPPKKGFFKKLFGGKE